MRILITGGKGFLGRNLTAHLAERKDCEVTIVDREEPIEELRLALCCADIVFHLAGINRPNNPDEFQIGNAELTEQICGILRKCGKTPRIIFSSSIQAELNNSYGASKRRAEETLLEWARRTGGQVRIFRLKNLFGKWCKPNYNSVVATFCHNIARQLPITISDPAHEIELSYIDDVVDAFLREIDGNQPEEDTHGLVPGYRISLGELAGRIEAFSEMRTTLVLPNFSEQFNRALYATYLSHVPSENLESRLEQKADARGSLAEFIKQGSMGQIFVSRTKPGITRGNHYHHTKTEKFFVVEGDGLIRMRAISEETIEEYRVAGEDYQIIDIPPGVTHSITNVGHADLVTLFWSNEIFNPDQPDTYYLPVDGAVQRQPKQGLTV